MHGSEQDISGFLGSYYLTLAPDLTLEDSGELAVGSFYAGVPHPPGYPVWTIFTYLFTVLVPYSNVAWRVALASAVSGASRKISQRWSWRMADRCPGSTGTVRRGRNCFRRCTARRSAL